MKEIPHPFELIEKNVQRVFDNCAWCNEEYENLYRRIGKVENLIQEEIEAERKFEALTHGVREKIERLIGRLEGDKEKNKQSKLYSERKYMEQRVSLKLCACENPFGFGNGDTDAPEIVTLFEDTVRKVNATFIKTKIQVDQGTILILTEYIWQAIYIKKKTYSINYYTVSTRDQYRSWAY